MFVEICLFLGLILLYALYRDRLPPNMPPGPWNIPFLGRMPILKPEQAEELRNKFGPIATIKTGSSLSVLVFDFAMAKSVLARPEFIDRPSAFKFAMVDDLKSSGLTMANGPQWQHDRRFFLRNLRDLGLGKSRLEEAIAMESRELIADLKLYEGKPVEYPLSLRTAPLNIIWQMVAGKRYGLRTKEVSEIYQAYQDLYRNSYEIALMMYFPWSFYLPRWFKKYVLNLDAAERWVENLGKLVDTTIEEHEEDLDKNNPRDLIDEYLIEMNKSEGPEKMFFRRGALRQIIADSFDAGSETISIALKWIVFLLVKFPKCTERLLQEIDAAVPRDRLLSLADKPKVPYVEAFVSEMLRYGDMVTVLFSHSAVKDTTIGNYFIPKNTTVTVYLRGFHTDNVFWNNALEFQPERFINENGKYEAPSDGYLPFSSGRRQCPGESLARTEIFLFLAALVQNFEICLPESATLDETIIVNSFMMRYPKDQVYCFKPRDHEN